MFKILFAEFHFKHCTLRSVVRHQVSLLLWRWYPAGEVRVLLTVVESW